MPINGVVKKTERIARDLIKFFIMLLILVIYILA